MLKPNPPPTEAQQNDTAAHDSSRLSEPFRVGRLVPSSLLLRPPHGSPLATPLPPHTPIPRSRTLTTWCTNWSMAGLFQACGRLLVSLSFAAEAYTLWEGPIKVLDIIIYRCRSGNLLVELSKEERGAVGLFPEEVWLMFRNMVKDELQDSERRMMDKMR